MVGPIKLLSKTPELLDIIKAKGGDTMDPIYQTKSLSQPTDMKPNEKANKNVIELLINHYLQCGECNYHEKNELQWWISHQNGKQINKLVSQLWDSLQMD